MNARNLLTVTAVTLAAGVLAAPAGAVPAKWSGNGHFYDVISGNYTWSEAKADAEHRNGHLATITSAGENQFISSTFGGQLPGRWLGGYQPSGSTEPAGGWTWVTGETWSYTHWNAGEPNNSGGTEDSLEMVNATDSDGYMWNDLTGADILSGYVIEWDDHTWAVPAIGRLGAALLVALLALAGLIVLKLRSA
jgi:Lectin C-type domain